MAIKERLWTRDFITIIILNFFIFLTYYVLVQMLPLYLAGVHGATSDQVGLLVTFFLAAAIAIRPFAGQWVAMTSQKKILVAAAVGFCVATLLYPLASGGVNSILLLRVFHGLMYGVLTTAKGTICAEMIPVSRRAEGLSYFAMSMVLGMVLGPYVGIAFSDAGAYTTGFYTCMGIAGICIVLCLVLRVPEIGENADVPEELRRLSLRNMFDVKAAPFALTIFILAIAWSGIPAFFALYTKGIGLATTASNFFLIYAGFVLVSRPFAGRWADRYGPKVIALPALALFAVGAVLISTTGANGVFLVAGAIIGVGYGSVTPILQTQIIGAVEPHRVGIANSLYFNSMDLGMAIGSYVLGVIAKGSGYQTIYAISVCVIVCAAVEYLLVTRRKKSPAS
ncbi:MAG: MFS transporter [Clostridiales Family XIII bacterium]|jgi:MFS family permease|nr:MFS transporter [Clostridiales Family XIII bacterium]